MGYVDLHSHVLPGLDDGAPDPATSLEMLRGLAAIGFDTVCATPHQKAGQFLPSRAAIEAAHAATSRAAAEAGLPLRLPLPLAAENMWDAVFHERMTADTIPSYDGGPAFLVELGRTHLPVGLTDHLFRLRTRGKLPVLAHPERYPALHAGDDALLDGLARLCALVVDLGAVAGYHGRPEARAARAMLQRGVAHAVASDAHTPTDVRAAAEGIGWIRRRLGADAVTRLLDHNPRRILAGEHPDE